MTTQILYQTFALGFLPAAIYMRLWRNSVSTFLFVLASAWCALTAPPEANEAVRFGGLLAFEIAAIVRAIIKPENDRWLPKGGGHRVSH